VGCARRRAVGQDRHLSLTEREEISRAIAAGESLRVIAGRLGRAASAGRGSWLVTVAGCGIGPTERIGRRGSKLAGPSGASSPPTLRCVPR